MLKDFTPRLYQQTILGTAAHKNTLVVLPTGLGKTAVAFLLATQRLHQYPNSKILMLAPTKPLCEQHVSTFHKHLDIDPEKVVLFTGSVKPEKREALWKDARVIVSTPQGIENDIINKRVKLHEVSLLVFDEAHHATGEYAYVWVAKQYDKTPRGRILALTASPGSDLEKIQEVCTNLCIERVEVRTDKDADVRPYVQETVKKWVAVTLPPEFVQIQKALQSSRKSKLLEAKGHGYCKNTDANKREMLGMQGELQRLLSSGNRDFEVMRSISLVAEAMKVDHALELLETQGLGPLKLYFEKLAQEAYTSKVKAVKNLAMDPQWKTASYLTDQVIANNVEHPKVTALYELVSEEISTNPDAKIIIFTQFRDSAEIIVEKLKEFSSQIFFGQAKKRGIGFSQKQQKEILDKFRNGEFNILVATSVAEEGLDIPKVDKVIFYEPVPSAIRSIQRRGRTGRLEKGEVTILVCAGTRDEGYRWASHHKEKRMYRNLEKLKTKFSFLQEEKETTLHKFISDEKVVAVLADHREKNNRIVKELIDTGLSVKTAQLNSADYVVSGKVGVELKKVPDFVASIIDGRLLDQVRDLKNNFPKAVVIIEGEEDIYSVRKIHANAIRGMLSSIALDYNVPVIYTKNPKDTAALLAVMAKREQDKDSEFTYHVQKPKSGSSQLEYVVSSLPGIGVSMARKLLLHFGSIKELMKANQEKIVSIEGVGPKTAETIITIIEKKYKKNN